MHNLSVSNAILQIVTRKKRVSSNEIRPVYIGSYTLIDWVYHQETLYFILLQHICQNQQPPYRVFSKSSSKLLISMMLKSKAWNLHLPADDGIKALHKKTGLFQKSGFKSKLPKKPGNTPLSGTYLSFLDIKTTVSTWISC